MTSFVQTPGGQEPCPAPKEVDSTKEFVKSLVLRAHDLGCHGRWVAWA